jgi:glycosyltransferase involved in cell wall biosynthesis
MKRVIISVTSDLITDQRVHKVAQSVLDHGYDVTLVGRQKISSMKLEKRDYKTKRFKLAFEKGPLFYVEYNMRLFGFLLFNKSDALIANDLDTLSANFLASKIKGVPLLYDSHEYFTGVPELLNRPATRKFWKRIENFIFPKLQYVYTVNESIRDLYEIEYNVPIKVVRNIPLCGQQQGTEAREIFPAGKKIVIYQGAINKDRGIEEAILAMKYLEGIQLVIAGDGDIIKEVKSLVLESGLSDKVKFLGNIPFLELSSYTRQAHLGISLEKDTNINYRFSLPNKLFDYIRAEVPVLASRLVEVEKIVEGFKIGTFIDSHEPEHIASRIKTCLEDSEQKAEWKINLVTASAELCWEKEENIFLTMLGAATS